MSSSQDILEHISAQLDVLTRIIISAALGERTKREQILTLGKAGLAPKDIAEILGTTGGTVRVTLSQHRKKTKKQRK